MAELLHLTTIGERVAEFGSSQSSGFARFISPFLLIRDFVLPHWDSTFFGLGPGAIDPLFNATDYTVHDPTWGKLFLEYGLLGFCALLGFVIACLFTVASEARWLAGALFFNYLLLGGNLLNTQMQVMILVLVLFPTAEASKPSHVGV